jgi:hypothetical protein
MSASTMVELGLGLAIRWKDPWALAVEDYQASLPGQVSADQAPPLSSSW